MTTPRIIAEDAVGFYIDLVTERDVPTTADITIILLVPNAVDRERLIDMFNAISPVTLLQFFDREILR